MSPFGGFDMPIQYSSIEEEHRAVRTACGVFDVSHMGEVIVTGPDATEFVNYIFTNDVSKAADGQCLYGMMLHSGNDAALTLAISVSGSEAAFVRQMNLRARALGLTQTHFANPHGLDSGENYSTALDLAHLAQAALQNAQLRAVVSTKTAVCAGRTLTNHNKLLWRYDGCIGVKTGYPRHAGRSLVSAAERDGRMLIAVTISDPDDWRDHTALLDYGFAVLGRDTPVYPQNRRIVWKNECKKFWRAAQASRAAGRRS